MRDNPRRVIFLSYWMPPRNAIGTIRSTHIVKHLPKYGWEIDTITAAFNGEAASGVKIAPYIETRYFDVKATLKRWAGIGARSTSEALRIGTVPHGTQRTPLQRALFEVSSLLGYPDDYAGWLPYATIALRKALRTGAYDAVLTSSPPLTGNIAAALACSDVPWLADMRDLWAENDSSDRSIIARMLDDRLERACLGRATALTASSTLSARRFSRRYPHKRCVGISSGFDLEEWQSIPFGRNEACTLLYAGSLYRGLRDPSPLFAALRELIDEGRVSREEVRVDLYVAPEPWLLGLIEQYALSGVVRVAGLLDRNKILIAERRADRLIVLLWNSATSEGIVPGKVFEYFGARRPVLAIGGPPVSDVDDLLARTGAGTRCRTVAEIKADVMRALSEHRGGGPPILNVRAVAEFSGEACARAFAEMLDTLTHRH